MTSTFKKDVTNAELERHMALPLAALMQTVSLRQKDTETATANHKKTPASSETQTSNSSTISDQEFRYLQSVADNPLLTVSQRRDSEGLTTDAANILKRQLVDLGLIEIARPNLGKAFGGTATFVLLTPTGWKAVGRKPQWVRPKNVSSDHFFICTQEVSCLREHGFDARLEYQLRSKRADYVVVKDAGVHAFEVEMHPDGNAVRNVVADLESSFFHVTVVAKNSSVLRAIEMRLEPVLTSEQWKLVTLQTVAELNFVKTLKSGRSSVRNAALQVI